jgi:glucose/arabinose dehydrogenase
MKISHRRFALLAFTTVVSAAALAVSAVAQNPDPQESIGQKFQFKANALAAPYATPATARRSTPAPRPPEAKLRVPLGFQATVFADGLTSARWLAVAPNGDVFLAEPDRQGSTPEAPGRGKITVLRDANNDGKAELRETYAEGLKWPHGMAFHNDGFYVADALGIYRYAYKDGDTKAGAKTQVTEPGAFGILGGHWTRNIAIDRQGRIFVAIGSNGNINEDEPHRAAISMVQNGKLVQYGTGLRNPVGIAFRPGTDDLYTVVNERDGLGDELVPDYMTRVQQGEFYGWPYAYLGQNPEPSMMGKRPDLVAKAKVPDVLFRSHSAPLGLMFYTGTQFPADYRGGAFVALHGSWNAATPRGYKIVYVPFNNNRPSGEYVNFALGFWTTGQAPAGTMGRPVGIVQARDGSLLVADDVGQAVWRISYSAPAR